MFTTGLSSDPNSLSGNLLDAMAKHTRAAINDTLRVKGMRSPHAASARVHPASAVEPRTGWVYGPSRDGVVTVIS